MVKVLHNSRSTGADRLILLAMANEAHSSGELTAYGRSLRRLAHRANVSERQASKSVKALADMGEVQILAQGDGRTSSDYLLTIPAEPLPPPASRPRSKAREEQASALPRAEAASSQGGTEFRPGMNADPPRAERSPAPSSRSFPVPPAPPPRAAAEANASDGHEGQLALIAEDGDGVGAAAQPQTPSRLDQEFADWWAAYPRKVAKPAGRRAFASAMRKLGGVATACADDSPLVEGTGRWITHWRQARTPMDKIPHPATWLNNEQWNDQPARRTSA